MDLCYIVRDKQPWLANKGIIINRRCCRFSWKDSCNQVFTSLNVKYPHPHLMRPLARRCLWSWRFGSATSRCVMANCFLTHSKRWVVTCSIFSCHSAVWRRYLMSLLLCYPTFQIFNNSCVHLLYSQSIMSFGEHFKTLHSLIIISCLGLRVPCSHAEIQGVLHPTWMASSPCLSPTLSLTCASLLIVITPSLCRCTTYSSTAKSICIWVYIPIF